MEGTFEIKTFVKFEVENSNVKTVRELINIETNEKTYRGFGMVGLTMGGRTIPQELEFDLPGADTIPKCFDIYDECKKVEAKKFVEMIEKAKVEQQKQIIMPGR